MKLKHCLWMVIFCMISWKGWSQIQLSPQAEIMAITCGADNRQLYSAFGHSAFRVSDPLLGIDWIYNYGTFDFNQPNFYLNFAKGNLLYMLSKQDYERFKNAYIFFNRSIYEQVLNLNPAQKQKLFDFLELNALPENKFYLYDYFYDNCATKLRDVLEQAFPDSIIWDHSHITEKLTFREMVDRYTRHQPWGDLGIDLCLGLPMDKTMEPYHFMFIPDYIFKAFENARIKTDTIELPLVNRSFVTYDTVPDNGGLNFWTPKFLFWMFLVLILGIIFIEFKKGGWFKWLDLSLFTILGLLGIFLLLLWFGTDHKSSYNFNLLWAMPLHIAVSWQVLKKTKSAFISGYFLVNCVLLLLLLFTWRLLPQGLHPSLVPLIIAISLRSLKIYLEKRSARKPVRL